jgi:hypothetical protein
MLAESVRQSITDFQQKSLVKEAVAGEASAPTGVAPQNTDALTQGVIDFSSSAAPGFPYQPQFGMIPHGFSMPFPPPTMPMPYMMTGGPYPVPMSMQQFPFPVPPMHPMPPMPPASSLPNPQQFQQPQAAQQTNIPARQPAADNTQSHRKPLPRGQMMSHSDVRFVVSKCLQGLETVDAFNEDYHYVQVF